MPLQLGLPDAIPPQYGALKEVSIHTVRARLRLLYHFSDLMYSSWRLLNLSPNNQVKFHLKKKNKLSSVVLCHVTRVSEQIKMDLSNRFYRFFIIKKKIYKSGLNQTLSKYCYMFSLVLTLTCQCFSFQKLISLKAKNKKY